MGLVNLNIDMSEAMRWLTTMTETAQRAVAQSGEQMAKAAHAHAIELANQRLHSRRQAFVSALSVKEIQKGVWLINLDKSARWIDEGMKQHEMINDLLKSRKTKTAKDGSRYLAVPMAQNKAGAGATQAQNDLSATVKSFLRNYNKNNPKDKIPYGSIERNQDGTPKLGLLHSFNIRNGPMKTQNGPGQGWGPIGMPRMGPTGIPFLEGIRVYQKEVNDPKAQGGKRVERSIMTFRTVSSKHSGSGRWTHPGLQPANIMNETYDWIMKEWETKIRPQILEQISSS
jgi:hypothetical protein